MQTSTSASANEQQIREIAYSIWEQAGRPAGQAEWHWEMAKQMTPPSKRATAKAAAPKTSARRKKAAASSMA